MRAAGVNLATEPIALNPIAGLMCLPVPSGPPLIRKIHLSLSKLHFSAESLSRIPHDPSILHPILRSANLTF